MTPPTPNHPFRDDVQCYVERLTYDFNTRSGVLRTQANELRQHDGDVIRLFRKIDPDVEAIQTISGSGGSRYDGTYRKVDGEWLAFRSAKAV